MPLTIDHHYSIPESEIDISFVRSSGPGGQKTNKTSTKAVLKWSLEINQNLPDYCLQAIRKKYHSKVNKKGQLVISSDETRHQAQNAKQVEKKLTRIIKQALKRPKKRKPTRPTKASIEKRIQDKKRRSEIKKGRGSWS